MSNKYDWNKLQKEIQLMNKKPIVLHVSYTEVAEMNRIHMHEIMRYSVSIGVMPISFPM